MEDKGYMTETTITRGEPTAKWRRFVLILGAAVLLGTIAIALAQGNSPQFPDVEEGHTRAVDIEFVARKGWFGGYEDGTFQPDRTITPRQMTTVFERAFPEGMTRAEFAAFLRGGDQRVLNGLPQYGLAVAEEHPDGYNPEDWDGTALGEDEWPAATDNQLRWQKLNCRWAFYARPGSCTTDPKRDHLVSVAEAHRSGGYAWNNDQRRRFYLDPDNLWVMTATENREKSDHDPAGWLPRTERCEYIRRWIQVKRDWGLSIDRDEWLRIIRLLSDCDGNDETAALNDWAGVPAGGNPDNWDPPAEQTTTTTAPKPAFPPRSEWDRFRTLACNQWLDQGYEVSGLRTMVAGSAAIGYDWGRVQDRDGDGEPCETQLGDGYLGG